MCFTVDRQVFVNRQLAGERDGLRRIEERAKSNGAIRAGIRDCLTQGTRTAIRVVGDGDGWRAIQYPLGVERDA